MATNREKFLIKNTLICLLKAVEGKVTTVELRNENSVTGTIDHVDGFMCISMSNVCFKTMAGKMTNFESFYVQGPHIRYVQIPDEIDMRKAMEYEVNKERILRAKMQKCLRQAAMKKMQKRQKQSLKMEKEESNKSEEKT
jgi:small nuclear ribonucleoprotein (snRNP)-like protein